MTWTRTLLLLVFTAVSAGAAGLFAQQFLPPDIRSKITLPDSASSNPQPPSMAQVSALGRLEPESEIIDVGAPTGSRLGKLEVKEGDFVEENAPLAYLDSHAEMAAALNYAKSQLAEADKRLEAETIYGDALIAEANQRIREVDEVLPRTIQAQEAEVRRSKAELEKSRQDLKRSQQLLGDATISQSQFDTVALVVRQAEEQLLRNEATLEQLTKEKDVKKVQALAALRSAEAGKTRAQLATQQQSLAEAVKLAEARLDRTVIRAPIAGQVLKVLTWPGETIGQQPVLKLGNTRAMVAVAEVYETDVMRIKVGQAATVKSKAFPGETLAGQVVRIGSLVQKNNVLGIDPTADADARVVPVRVLLKDSKVAARFNNLQVDVYIDAPK